MAKYFIDVVQDSPRTGLGIPVKTKKNPSFEPIHRPRNRLSALNFTGLPSAATHPLGRPTSRASQGRNEAIPPPKNADGQVRPRRRTAGAGPDAISTGPRCCRALHAHRAPSSSSPG